MQTQCTHAVVTR